MKLNLAVLFGGASVEHEISVISAVQAMRSLNREKYEVLPIYITKQGEMYYGDPLLDIENFKDTSALISSCQRAVLQKEEGGVFIFPAKSGLHRRKPIARIDIAFPIVHGTNCEDGSIQGMLEVLGLPYVGCDVVSSAVGMDKVLFKNVIAANGIATLPCFSFYSKQWYDEKDSLLQKIKEEIGYPLIVKPANLGSSVGIGKAEDDDQLAEAVSLASSFAQKIMVERAVTSLREINCSVLGDTDECECSVCEEPVMSDEILSYKDKYLSSSSSKGMSSLKRKIPAELSDDKAEEIKGMARETFLALGCNGVVRIDFLLDTADGDKVYVNEINTIPGSLSFYLWDAAGMKYPELLDRMIELARKRARQKQNLMFTYDTNILSTGGALGKGVKK